MVIKPQRALISVSDKTGLAEFARQLHKLGIEIFSTGGTRLFLEQAGVPVKDVAAYTGFPEMMEGRVKTLHPRIFGGILARRDRPEDLQSMEEHGILAFDLVVVNLYPFRKTIERPGCTEADAIENIDIGGPSLVRAAAKNHAFVAVVTQPAQYAQVLSDLQTHDGITLELRRRLAAEAFAHTAEYDQAIATWFAKQVEPGVFPPRLFFRYDRISTLRYGENPHQQAAVYAVPEAKGPSVVTARQLHGKELSYNNLLDLESALEIVRHFEEPATSVIKHNNPCGAAVADSLAEATRKALAGDPVSAFGSVLGMNRVVDRATAEVLCEPGLFVEAIIAPAFNREALEMLTTVPKWKKNVRLMEVGELARPAPCWSYRPLQEGLLVQDADNLPDDETEWKVVTQVQPDDALLPDLRFAWAMVRFVKSNAIVLAKDQMLVGVGAGQMSRVDSVEIAIRKAGDRAAGSVLASDAFFPFPDSIEHAAKAGIRAIIQPGGSVRDEEVIAACNQHGIPMIFTGRRHFRH
ncbi:MAG: bifunctional purine biosynthesis protein PurH [Thermogutta sp.]|nr:MAG: bifunctional purine biosynthesis protein PurH [Thermogutta sp.]